jgi:hypothetical protein
MNQILRGILPADTSLALNQIGDFDTNSDTNADTFRETLGNKTDRRPVDFRPPTYLGTRWGTRVFSLRNSCSTPELRWLA